MKSFETTIRVEYHHTDQMGIVHHSNYIKFFEVARTEWLRAVGMTYAEMERRGVMMPIVDVQVKYKQPAYYDELIKVRAFVDALPMARMTFRYEIHGEDGRERGHEHGAHAHPGGFEHGFTQRHAALTELVHAVDEHDAVVDDDADKQHKSDH